MDIAAFIALALACAPQVHPDTARAIVVVESAFNPYAIGVVGGALERQPRTRAEALATVKELDTRRWNYSVGLGQINVSNFGRLGTVLIAELASVRTPKRSPRRARRRCRRCRPGSGKSVSALPSLVWFWMISFTESSMSDSS